MSNLVVLTVSPSKQMSLQKEHTVELYCGPEKPFSRIASFLGYETTTFDPNPEFQADVIAAVADLQARQFPPAPLMIWMAPPSEGFDDKSGWDASNFGPVTARAQLAENGLEHCLNLAYQLKPKWWFLEAPKSFLRQLPIMRGFNRGYSSRSRYTIRPQDFGGSGKQEIDVYTNAFWWLPQGTKETPAATTRHTGRAPPSLYLDMLNQYDDYIRKKGER